MLAEGPVHWLGWRPVPTRDDVLPDPARKTRPHIEQLLLRVEGDADVAEASLYRARLELRHRFRQAGLDVYIPTLSARLVGYKGLLTSHQFADFYPDLADPAFETGLALFHRRYSTNTYPNWTLAQPFRLLCHNGEINTIRTTRNAVHAYARGLEPPMPGRDLLTAGVSDSASLDEWVEHLVHAKGWGVLRALRLSVPPVWDSEADDWGQEAVDLFTYGRRAFGGLAAWGGPAGVVATDGRVLILGPVENEIGSGMTGGELYVFDPKTEVPAKLHSRSVAVVDTPYVDYEWMHPLIVQYHARTGSRQAEYVLKHWAEIRRGRRLRKVVPLAVARKAENFAASGTNAG